MSNGFYNSRSASGEIYINISETGVYSVGVDGFINTANLKMSNSHLKAFKIDFVFQEISLKS